MSAPRDLREAIEGACTTSTAVHDASIRRAQADRAAVPGIPRRFDPNFRAINSEYRLALSEYRQRVTVVRRLFAASRGWTIGKHFTIRMLRAGSPGRTRDDYRGESLHPVIDHPEYFRLPVRPWRPAAILSHSYVPREQILTFAADRGLDAEFLESSWYYPGGTTAVVLTAKVQQ
ncbi:MAG: hypothetical protein M0038_05285 [Pseudomonadota bacterium]|nr:hypothetical protein [Pseudomonadota bacterium]